MTSLATLPTPSPAARRPSEPKGLPPGWHRATVLDDAGAGLWCLRAGAQQVRARQAFSCLVAVQAGDTVAALLDDQQQWWVMAVLERGGAQDVVLQARGALELHAGTVVRAQGGERLELDAPQLRLRCEQADAVAERANLIGGAFKLIGATLSTLFDRVHHHSKQHTRHTEGLDRTQAEHMELQARQLLQVHGEHALIEGEKLVKARGAQIHFG